MSSEESVARFRKLLYIAYRYVCFTITLTCGFMTYLHIVKEDIAIFTLTLHLVSQQ